MAAKADPSFLAPHRRKRASLMLAAPLALGLAAAGMASAPHAAAQAPTMEDAVYRGRIHYPDFAGRDQAFAKFRTRIRAEMRGGPNFAGHYAMVEIGCGTGCLTVYVADVATGQVFDFPYGGDGYYTLALTYDVKEPLVEARWLAEDGACMKDTLKWDGAAFASIDKRVIGDESACRDA